MALTSRSGGEIEASVRACLCRHGVGRGARLLVAVSGGPDSTALLHVLHRLSAEAGFQLVGAYLDHGLHSAQERARERRLVEGLCAGLRVPLAAKRLAAGSLQRQARRDRRSLEELARIRRYAFLRRTARALGSTLIAVGHTADDQAETVLMRLLQGAGVEALGGIPERRGQLLRPLLRCTRAAVLRYLARFGLPSHEDSSNDSLQFLRNRVRHRLSPLLEELAPGFRGGLARLGGQLQQVRALLEEQARMRLPWRPVHGGFVLGLSAYLDAPPLLRAISLRLQIQALGLSDRKVPQRFLAPALCAARAEGARTLLCGYGLCLLQSGDALVLSRHVVGAGEKGYFILGRRVRSVAVPAAGFVVDFNVAADRGPLVRSHRPGDIIRVERGAKSVDKILSEWRVPPGERWKVPVVEDERGILAVLGGVHGFSDRFRADAPEKLGLTVRRTGPSLLENERE